MNFGMPVAVNKIKNPTLSEVCRRCMQLDCVSMSVQERVTKAMIMIKRRKDWFHKLWRLVNDPAHHLPMCLVNYFHLQTCVCV